MSVFTLKMYKKYKLHYDNLSLVSIFSYLHIDNAQILHRGDSIHMIEFVELAHFKEEDSVKVVSFQVPPLTMT